MGAYMNLWLGVDVESTGLCSQKDRVVELGYVVWDWEAMQPVHIENTLVKTDVGISPEAAAVNGLSTDLVNKWGVEEKDALYTFEKWVDKVDHVVAHNAPFDQGMINAGMKRHDYSPFEEAWLDSSVDVPYPQQMKSRKLIMLAAEHGFLNPFPHRAVTDVLTMFKVLSCYDPEEIIKTHQAPTVTLRAMVLKPWTDDGKSTGAAKSIGYRWDQGNKIWKKNIKDFQMEDEIKLADEKGFKAIALKGDTNGEN